MFFIPKRGENKICPENISTKKQGLLILYKITFRKAPHPAVAVHAKAGLHLLFPTRGTLLGGGWQGFSKEQLLI